MWGKKVLHDAVLWMSMSKLISCFYDNDDDGDDKCDYNKKL